MPEKMLGAAAAGIAAYLANGGAIEQAQEMAAHESPHTTGPPVEVLPSRASASARTLPVPLQSWHLMVSPYRPDGLTVPAVRPVIRPRMPVMRVMRVAP